MNLTLLFILVSQTFNLPPGALSAICYVESGHNPAAIHSEDGTGNSVGACQIKRSTALLMGYKGTEADLHHDIRLNVFYSGKYLKYQLDRYNNLPRAIAAYNSGSVKYDKKGQIRNRAYVNKVLTVWGHQ